jgi:hypothetical protein
MADTLKRIVGPLQLAAAAATLYTVPAATTTTIRGIHVVNTTAGTVTFTMSIGADAAGTRIFNTYSITAGDVYDWSGTLVMAATEILQAYANAATSLTATVSGVESA